MQSGSGMLLMLSIAFASLAQGQSLATNSKTQPKSIHRDHFNTWKTTGKNPQGKVRFTDSVPVYFLDTFHRREIGKIAIGTEIKLDKVNHFRGVLHYAVPFKSKELDDIKRVGWKGLAWVSGETIEATAFKPSDQ